MPTSAVKNSPSLLRNPGGELSLRIRGTGRDGQVIRLTAAKSTIGKADYCTLQLRNSALADLHCLILRGERQTVVRRWSEDTRLNGRGFDDAPLTVGDCLSIGPLDFEVLPSPAVVGEPAAPWQSRDPQAAERERRIRRRRRRRTRALLETMRADQEQLRELQSMVDAHQNSWHDQQADSHRLHRQHAEIEQAKQLLAERQGDLARREDELAERSERLEADTRELEERREQWLRECEEQQAERDARQSDLAAREQELVEAQASLNAAQASLADREQQLQTQAGQQHSEVDQQQMLDQRQAELAEESQRLAQQRDQLAAERAALADEQAAWEQAQQQALEDRQALDDEQAQLQQERNELAAERTEFEQLRTAWQADSVAAVEADAAAPADDALLPGDESCEDATIQQVDETTSPAADTAEINSDRYDSPAAEDASPQDETAGGLSTLSLLSQYDPPTTAEGVAGGLLDDKEEEAADIFGRLRDLAVLRDAEETTTDAPQHPVAETFQAAPEQQAPPESLEDAASTAAADAAEAAADADDSIEQYMAGLLQRMRGGDSTPPAEPSHVHKPTTSSRPKTVQAVQPTDGEAAADWDPTQMPPRRSAPEQNTDIAKMRALANMTTKSAIDASRHRRLRTEAISKGLVSGIATIAGIVLISLSPNVLSMGFLGGVAALIVGTNWAIRGAQLMRTVRQEQRSVRQAEALIQKAEQDLQQA
ncbi:MAG: hypothetical protein WD030_11600 [Pirellulales bacterium]